ncbi:tyrosine-type recombinase/integrase [Rhodopseudomonas palustris]|uniref:tyrosine-type recombinase/integrase n=1 Tax=Rhodopseudomonas palustris TaxID=1076 RepID=UPI000CEC4528|nr:tyrosine-type recombinase/integrase [Rhodopseudomonas palustris]PPQ42110.1 hypothetical protein CKO39_18140 [Rhodopseudomonas palustris]
MTEAVMPPLDCRYLYKDTDRHGNDRYYFRKRGQPKIRIRAEPGTVEFHQQFAAALAGQPLPGSPAPARPLAPRVVVNSLRWLVEEYYRRSQEFRAYDESTQKVRRAILRLLCDEPMREGSPDLIGEMHCELPEEVVIKLRDRKALTSVDSANMRVKALRQLYKWAVKVQPKPLVTRNTAKAVELLERIETGGHHTWTIEEIQQFKRRHPIGTKAYLALNLFLLTGQRLSDVARLGKQHIRRPEHVSEEMRRAHPGRWLAFRQQKNRRRSPVDLVIPILPELEEVLAASTCGDLNFLETEFGQPYTTKGLGNWFGDRCVEAGVPGRAHGLRKAGATIAAERGATPHQLMAIFGWKTLQQAELYTKKANQQRIAGSAMNLVWFGQTVNEGGKPKKAKRRGPPAQM